MEEQQLDFFGRPRSLSENMATEFDLIVRGIVREEVRTILTTLKTESRLLGENQRYCNGCLGVFEKEELTYLSEGLGVPLPGATDNAFSLCQECYDELRRYENLSAGVEIEPV